MGATRQVCTCSYYLFTVFLPPGRLRSEGLPIRVTDCVRNLIAGQGGKASSFVSGSLAETKFGHPLLLQR